jgi:hypothetical protein
MRRFSVTIALTILCGALLSAVMSADDGPVPAAAQKTAKQKGANRGAAVARLLGPLDAAYSKMDADGDGKVSEEEFGKFLETASNGRVKGALASQIYRTYDEDHDGNLTLAELRKLESPDAAPAPKGDAAAPTTETTESKPPVVLEPRGWKSGEQATFSPASLDKLLAEQQLAESRDVAAILDDAGFLRRVTLDLTGRLPTAAEVEAFLSTANANKRGQAIDRLLASEDFGHYWGHFWKDAMQSKASSTKVLFELHRGAALEAWLAKRFNANRSWAEVAHDLIAAQGVLYAPGESEDGNVGLMLCHSGKDAEVGRAVDTTRLFLGIQLECAQCHDHPTDIWKRQQFHELAAYYARLNDVQALPTAGSQVRGLRLTSLAKGEYEMPDKYDTSKTSVVHPRFFLTGAALPEGRDDMTRREALAREVTASPWFAKALVNRTWGKLMGRGFVEPVDNLGPSQEPIFPEVLETLAAAFAASDFNIKELLATITGSEAYQREIRFGETRHTHTHFAASYPQRLRGEELWDSLTVAVGPFAEKTPLPEGLRQVLDRIRDPDFFTLFKRLFDFDPTAGANEVEPSVAQTLMILNNTAINAQIKATGDTLLAKIVERYPQTDDAIRQVYLQVLSRRPSEAELGSCRDYVREVGNRNEAFEDLMWALVNSAEFRIKH